MAELVTTKYEKAAAKEYCKIVTQVIKEAILCVTTGRYYIHVMR